MVEQSKTSAGVQELIGRIRDQGIQAAKDQADRVVKEAETQAAKMVADAKAEVDRMREKAQAEIEANRAAAMEALRLSARDTVLQLKSRVAASFEVFLKRLVTSATRDEELIKALVLVLAGHAVDEFIKDKEIHILLSDAILTGQSDEKLRQRGKQVILTLSSDMLREGIELIPSSEIEGGARVRLVKDQLEIDLSDRAITKMLYERTLPRFRAIVEGVE